MVTLIRFLFHELENQVFISNAALLSPLPTKLVGSQLPFVKWRLKIFVIIAGDTKLPKHTSDIH